MAAVRAQVPSKARDVQADAALANSVPGLREQVIKLAEDNEELRARLDKLERSIRG